MVLGEFQPMFKGGSPFFPTSLLRISDFSCRIQVVSNITG
jgi:hypothetical protein